VSRKLRIPAALAFTALGTAAVIGIGSSASCGDDGGPIDAPVADFCSVYCIPDPPGPDAACPPCADEMLQCPTGCRPVG
jgi:hypothetical protein